MPHEAKRRLLWHGILLVLLALAQGAFVQSFTNPRLGLSAHVGGIMNGTLVVAVGLLWTELVLAPRAASILFWSMIVSGYANWLGLVFAGWFGTSATTPLHGAGHAGTAAEEVIVALLLTGGAVLILVGGALVLAGLRRR